MSTTITSTGHVAAPPPPEPTPLIRNYLNHDYSLWSWLTTVDHKRIGILYLVSITTFFLIGGIAAGLVRLNLLAPNGAILSEDAYNRAFTAHGVLMLFFFLDPCCARCVRKLLCTTDDWCQRSCLPKIELGELVCLHAECDLRDMGNIGRRHRYRLDTIPTLYIPVISI